MDLGIKNQGVASWYGEAFHGRLAANGEEFDKTTYTAAHRKLPLGSIVRVMNLHNGKVVRVRAGRMSVVGCRIYRRPRPRNWTW